MSRPLLDPAALADPARGSGGGERGPVSSEPVGNSLLEAMRDQFGLKLDLKKGPVDVIVIDQVAQPTEN
jgi:uncharacterized protein (TIGR03435 family)